MDGYRPGNAKLTKSPNRSGFPPKAMEGAARRGGGRRERGANEVLIGFPARLNIGVGQPPVEPH